MRLVDADKIDFRQVFGGNSEFAKDIISAAQGLVDAQPIAFDKTKVIERFKSLAEDSEKYWDEFGDKVCFGEMKAYMRAAKIVEKKRHGLERDMEQARII